MPLTSRTVLFDANIRSGLQQAWIDSNPGATGGHEEGGFVVRDADGDLSVIRWQRGLQDTIQVPPHRDCTINDLEIVASFHTHPNTGSDYLQEPSETDKRAVRDDPDLKGNDYVGEFVISQAVIYLISPAGQVREMDDTETVFNS
ncbi:MAG: DUF4329 domain-containing protein [Anaerolineales bacterium]|nr:DUF4329 domain-containing protein [Anaerolineales bacterium]